MVARYRVDAAQAGDVLQDAFLQYRAKLRDGRRVSRRRLVTRDAFRIVGVHFSLERRGVAAGCRPADNDAAVPRHVGQHRAVGMHRQHVPPL